jgi:hypothetical protein
MADLSSILTDPNYVNANAATKAAIFDKFSAQDKNFIGANPETQQAIRVKFGVADLAPAAAPMPTGGIPGQRRATDMPTQFGRSTAGLLDTAIGNIPATIVQQVGYAGARLGNTPERATEISQAMAEPLRNPVGRLTGVEQTPEYQQEAGTRLMNFIGQNVNKGAEWIAKKTGLPAADVSNMIGTLSVATPDLIQGAKQLNTLAPVQKVTNALTQAREKAAGSSAGVAATAVGSLAGKAPAAFSEAYKAGKAGETSFLENLRGKASPDELLATVKEGVDKIRLDNSVAYQNAKTGWAADKTPLDFQSIDNAFQKVKDSYTVNGKSKIGAAEQKIVDEIGTVLDEWRADPNARTALDLDALKQRIDAIYPDSPKHTQAQRAVTDVRNAVKDAIVQQAPDYAQAMKNYDTQMSLLRDVTKALGTSDKIAKETAINKVMMTLKSTPSAEFRRQLVDVLQQQGGVNIMPAVAGQELSQFIPTSGVGRAVAGGGLTAAYYLHHPELAAILPFTSPRLMGEAFYKMGQASGAGGRAVNALANMSPGQAAYAAYASQQNQNALVQ